MMKNKKDCIFYTETDYGLNYCEADKRMCRYADEDEDDCYVPEPVCLAFVGDHDAQKLLRWGE